MCAKDQGATTLQMTSYAAMHALVNRFYTAYAEHHLVRLTALLKDVGAQLDIGAKTSIDESSASGVENPSEEYS
jgi:hypothetical protein